VGVLDYVLLLGYLGGVLALSWVIARRQKNGTDYFLAGKRMGGGLLATSVLANQVSAVSLVGAPAFVAIRAGGGLTWLQYELALPLAMLVLMGVLLPLLRRTSGSSIYAFAELRFGRGTRKALAGIFLLSRGLSLGVILYASALVVAMATGWPVEPALLAIGLFSVAYTCLGGIAADIWSDVLQLVVLLAGTLAAILYLLWRHGWGLILAIPTERVTALDLQAWGLTHAQSFGFWPMLFGGFFLYLSYYGCDQSQAQRLLAAKSDGAAQRVLLLNGLFRFPLVLCYCFLGLLLAGLLQLDPAFAASLKGKPMDSLVPTFMITYLPLGLRGLMMAAFLAAAMSSIDSTLNALAAVTLEDAFGQAPERQSVWAGRGVSLGWGLLALASGVCFARTDKGVLELINQVGSLFYGPVLAIFLLGQAAPKVAERSALMGLASGPCATLLLATLMPGLSWLWWNPVGFLTTLGVALVHSHSWLRWPKTIWPHRETRVLLGAFVAMLALLVVFSK
jgi:SSS family solute:Na+ symporter